MEWLKNKKIKKELKETGQEPEKPNVNNNKIENLKKSLLDQSKSTTILKKMIPQLIIGFVIFIAEYEFIGIEITIGTLIPSIIIIYMYTKSIRTKDSILVFEVNGEKEEAKVIMILYAIPRKLWNQITKHGLFNYIATLNGYDVIMADAVNFVEGTMIPYSIELAFPHLSQLDWLQGKAIIPKYKRLLSNFMMQAGLSEDMIGPMSDMKARGIAKNVLRMMETAHRGTDAEANRGLSEIYDELQKLEDEAKAILGKNNSKEVINDTA